VTHLDTSALVAGLTQVNGPADSLRSIGASGERLAISTLALYEWLRGPRTAAQLEAQERLFPREQAAVFDARSAALAAELYTSISRPRGREIDIAIAACAIAHGASLWTLNPADFRDIRGLDLHESRYPSRAAGP
jgi:predicted nucleic acid-binding protein